MTFTEIRYFLGRDWSWKSFPLSIGWSLDCVEVRTTTKLCSFLAFLPFLFFSWVVNASSLMITNLSVLIAVVVITLIPSCNGILFLFVHYQSQEALYFSSKSLIFTFRMNTLLDTKIFAFSMTLHWLLFNRMQLLLLETWPLDIGGSLFQGINSNNGSYMTMCGGSSRSFHVLCGSTCLETTISRWIEVEWPTTPPKETLLAYVLTPWRKGIKQFAY